MRFGCDIFHFTELINRAPFKFQIMNKFKLDKRMIDFSVNVIHYTESFPKTNSGTYYSDQIMRSVSSAVLNYSEA